MRNINRILVESGGVGVAIAAVPIFFEAVGRWQTSDSLRYFAFAFPVVLIPWVPFVWSRIKCVPRDDG